MKSNNNFGVEVKVSTITKSMVCFGLAGIIIPKFINSENNIFSTILNIIEIIGTTLFSSGLVSVIVEISTIKNLVTHAFRNILCGDFELDGLNQNALITLKNKIASKLVDVNEKNILNSPYKYEKKLLDMVNEKYYEHHNITYHITPDENNGCFHVRTIIDYHIVNKNQIENYFEVRLKLYKIPNANSDSDIGNNFEVKIKINKENIDTNDVLSIEPVTHQGESTYYDSKVIIYKDLKGVRNKIRAEILYDVPLFDICQSFKISAPCKNIEHKFYINKDVQTGQEWMIQANAYSTFYHRQDEEESNYKVEQNVDDSLIIRFKDWALVGNGYCVFYQKKT